MKLLFENWRNYMNEVDTDNDGIDDEKELAVIDKGELGGTSEADPDDVTAIQQMLMWEYDVLISKEPRSRELAEKIWHAYPDADWMDFDEDTMPPAEEIVKMASELGVKASPEASLVGKAKEAGGMFKAPEPNKSPFSVNPLSTREQAAEYARRGGYPDPYGTTYEE